MHGRDSGGTRRERLGALEHDALGALRLGLRDLLLHEDALERLGLVLAEGLLCQLRETNAGSTLKVAHEELYPVAEELLDALLEP